LKKEQKFKVFRLFSTLSGVEIKAFGRFLKCGYFTKDPQLIKFYDYLKRFTPEFDDVKLGKQVLSKKFFPKQEDASKKITNLMFHFSNQLENFLLIKELEKDKQRKNVLQSVYLNRSLIKDFDLLLDQQIQQLEAVPCKDVTDFEELLSLHYHKYYNLGLASTEMNVENLKRASINLDYFFILNKLTLDSEILSRGLMFPKEVDRISFNDLEKLSLFFEKDSNILIQLYTYIPKLYRLLEGDAAYFELKKIFLTNFEKISIDEQQKIHLHLVNFTMRRMNDIPAFTEEAFELYEFAITHKMLFDNNQITDNRFANIVNIACAIEKLEWAENFIETHYMHLAEKSRDNAKNVALSLLRFHQKRYSSAIQYLIFVEFTDSIYAIRVKALEIRCYLELFLQKASYYQVLTAKLDAFYRFAQRGREMSDYKRKLCGNFVLIIRQIVKWKMNHSQQKDKSALIKFVENKNPYPAKKWIQEKIEEL